MRYKDRCKCCLEAGRLKNLWTKYISDGELEIYGEMISKCFSLSWEPPEHNGKEQICELCVGRLRNAFAFKKQVLATEQLLLEQLEEEEHTEDNQAIIKIITAPVKESSHATSATKSIFIETLPQIQQEETEHILQIETSEETQNVNDPENYDSEEENTITNNNLDHLETEEEFMDIEYLEEHETDMKKKLQEEKDQFIQKESPKIKYVNINRRDYTKEDLAKCLDDVMCERLTVSAAAAMYNIPRQTIRNRIFKEVSKEKQIKPEKIERPIMTPRPRKKPLRRQKSSGQDSDEETRRLSCHEKTAERRKHQDNIRSILLYTNATPIRKRCDAGYMCCFCNEMYQNPGDLKQHTIQHHDDEKTKTTFMQDKDMCLFVVKLDITGLQCNLCYSEVDTLEDILEHLKGHYKDVHMDLKNHIIPLKFNSEVLTCFMCGATFNFFKMLTQHMSEHYRNFECERCGLFFINSRSYSNHNRRHASGTFPCSYCPKIFDARIKRTHHERIVHKTRRNSVACSFCNEKFRDDIAKKRHLSSKHGIKFPERDRTRVSCNACDKTFASQRHLTKHIQQFHLNVKRFKCYDCGKEFYEKRGLAYHMLSHTKARDFECEVCHRKYPVKSTLMTHMRIHYDDRRYKCDCGVSFVQKHSLLRHVATQHCETTE